MRQNPEISVVMPVYNESIHDLHDSMDSILNQTYKNFEYIIVDDNPSNVKIKSYIKKRAKSDSRIRLFFNKYNGGVVVSENKGIRNAQGKYIARLDADDISAKDRLENQLKFLKHFNLDFIYSNFSLMSNDNEITRKYTYSKNNLTNQTKIKDLMTKRNIAVGPTFFFTKELFNSLNGYRNINGDDYDLAARALIKGFRLGYQALPLVIKRLRKNGISCSTLFDQYVMIKTIGHYLKKYNYTKIMPLSVLYDKWEHINKAEKKHFENYAYARYSFNDKQNISNFLELLKTILCSKVVFKKCLWSAINKIQERY